MLLLLVLLMLVLLVLLLLLLLLLCVVCCVSVLSIVTVGECVDSVSVSGTEKIICCAAMSAAAVKYQSPPSRLRFRPNNGTAETGLLLLLLLELLSLLPCAYCAPLIVSQRANCNDAAVKSSATRLVTGVADVADATLLLLL